MSSQPPRRPLPSWRGGKEPARPAGRSAPGRAPAAATTHASGLPWKKIALGVISATFGVTVAAVIFWVVLPTPPIPLQLVVLQAGYEKNLAVPHNAFGRFGAQQLRAWARQSNSDVQ